MVHHLDDEREQRIYNLNVTLDNIEQDNAILNAQVEDLTAQNAELKLQLEDHQRRIWTLESELDYANNQLMLFKASER